MSTKPGDWWDTALDPIEGCVRISEACTNCWCLQMLHRFKGQEPGQFRSYQSRLDAIRKWKRKPRHVFVGCMTDMMLEYCWSGTRRVLAHAEANPKHKFIFLTKRPHLALDLLDATRNALHPATFELPNVWLGITVENQPRLEERWEHFAPIPAAVKFLHAEPLLGPLHLSGIVEHVQWMVVGGENGPKARPMHPDWVRGIQDQCVAAGVKFWFKSWGYWVPIHGDGIPRLSDDEEHPWTWVTRDGKTSKTGNALTDSLLIHWNGDPYKRNLDGRTWEERP